MFVHHSTREATHPDVRKLGSTIVLIAPVNSVTMTAGAIGLLGTVLLTLNPLQTRLSRDHRKSVQKIFVRVEGRGYIMTEVHTTPVLNLISKGNGVYKRN